MRRTIALALVALVALAAAAALPGCGCQKQAVENTTGKIDVAKDAAVKAQIVSIQTGIQATIATSGSAPADASQATLGGFVASKFTFHPIASLRSLVRAVTNDYEKRYFDKLLRALIVTVGRLFVSPCRGAPATRPGIDYRRFPIKDLVRARCLEPGAAAQRECLGRAPHSPTPA